jgi:hypothetical protein
VLVRAKNRMGNTESAAASGTPFALRLCDGANFATPLDNLASTPGATPLDKAFNWIAAHAEQDAKYVIILGADETQAAKALNAGSAGNVTITLKGDDQERTVQLSGTGSLYSIGAANLTLVLGTNITLRGIASNDSPLVIIGGGTLVMEDRSKITGNTIASQASRDGGGVFVYGGTFIMNGGIITGNHQTGSRQGLSVDRSGGGGVRLMGKNSTFIMNAGEISGNTALRGGGVYVNRGHTNVSGIATFIMKGGKICNNTATSEGGGGVGVENTANSIFTMTGGEIFGNRSTNSGTCYGAGVFVARDAIFKKQPAEGETESGVIYGYDANNEQKSNVVGTAFTSPKSNVGHAVYKSASQKREKTVTASQSLDSAIAGATGGWSDN